MCVSMCVCERERESECEAHFVCPSSPMYVGQWVALAFPSRALTSAPPSVSASKEYLRDCLRTESIPLLLFVHEILRLIVVVVGK